MKILRALLTAAALTALGAATAAAATLWVSSAGAKLKAEQRALSRTVAELDAGAELLLLEEAGSWYRVSTTAGDEGWIYRGKVSDAPPEEEVEGGGLFGAITSSSIEAGAADTSRSIRGLSPETEQYAESVGSSQSARDALDAVTALAVSEEAVEEFLQQGRIGEYAQ